MNEDKQFKPDWISSPGDTIADILDSRGMNEKELSLQIGKPINFIKQLISGKAAIDDELASLLSNFLGGSIEFWLAREQKYRNELKELESGERFLKKLPTTDMINFGWISKPTNQKDLLSKCKEFFQLSDIKNWNKTYRDFIENAAFRTSPTFASQTGSVAAWLRQGEIIAQTIKCKNWEPERLREKLQDLRKLTRLSDPEKFIPKLINLLADCGIALVILRAPTGCRASGATRRLGKNKFMLLLSFRYLSDDHFWFTFFHEIAHVLLHHENPLFLDEVGGTDSAEEIEANDFAANLLIPSEYKSELVSLGTNAQKVIRFAARVGVSPGIVVGQLQHLNIIGREQLNNLKIRFTWDSD